MDHNSQGRRGHFHRGRRGPDRRGTERREGPPPEQQAPRGDRVDVEQIMRDIRARISQRSGIELSNQQIQELAARRLEAILDPRGLKPGLLDQLRRAAGERTTTPETAQHTQPYTFEEATLYDSHRGLVRFIRRLLNPILKLFFNPTPVAHTFALQARWNAESAAREAERDRRQAEWNALHYEILQRLVTEVSRASLEAHSISLRVESLGAKVDFNERRVRGLEGTPVRPARVQDSAATPPQPAAAPAAAPATEPPVEGPPAEAPRRRRRRRRGRRGTGAGPGPSQVEGPGTGTGARPEGGGAPATAGVADAESDADEEFEDESPSAVPEPNQEEPMARPVEPAVRQAETEVPLDHRLPESASHHEEAPPSPAPPRADSEPGTPEQG